MTTTPPEFEWRYRMERDPWDYERSEYEHAKYAETLEACGIGPFRSALELGASIGVFTEMLAPRCEQLVAIDCAPTAVAAARVRLAAHPHARVELGTLPVDLPGRCYDLVVASEVLYYLNASALRWLLTRLRDAMLPGARLVAVHWIPSGPERPLQADRVHAMLNGQPWLARIESRPNNDYLLDVLERR